MKIQCAVCNKAAASVYCVADDAALCSACDHRVHHANKLAGKHHRFSLLHPKQAPLCDICKEKRGFLFCQQDRAILCRDCDFSIHKANEFKRTHNRFLLTGTKLSVESAVYSPPQLASHSGHKSSSSETTFSVPRLHSNIIDPTNYSIPKTAAATITSPSSISDYLIDPLPDWHVHDFLDFSSSPFDFCKGGEEDLMINIGGEESNNGGRNQCLEASSFWVPQAPPPLHPSQYTVIPPPNMAIGDGGGGAQTTARNNKEATNLSKSTTSNTKETGKSTARKRSSEDWSFTVPQIRSPQSFTSKRSTFAG